MSRLKSIFIPLLVVLLTLSGFTAVAQLQSALTLTADQDRYPLERHIDILEDEDGLWTIEDVTSPELSQQFVPNQGAVPNFGFTDSAYWVRFRVIEMTRSSQRWLLAVESNLFFIDVYVPTSDTGQYQVTRTGTFLPFNTRELQHPKFLFTLPLTTEEEQTIYLRFESEAAMNFPLTIWSADAVAQDDLIQQTLSGFIYGVLLIMAGYNFILFLYLRDRSYLYYCLFLSFLLLSYMVDDNFAHQYLWPEQGRINAIGGQLFFVLTIMAAIKFTTSFLPSQAYVPRLHMTLNLAFIALALLLPIQLIDIGITARPNFVLILISYILIVAAGIIIWRRGYQPARYFLLAWVLLLTSMLIYVVSLFAIFPQSTFPAVGSQIGIVVLTLTLSLALADRISTYRQEKEAAEVAREQEAERRRLAEGLGDVLEALNSEKSLHEILDLVATSASRLLQANGAIICHLNSVAETVSVEAIQGLPEETVAATVHELGYTSIAEAVKSGQPKVFPNGAGDPNSEVRKLHVSEPETDETYQAIVVVPILLRGTEPYGCLMLMYIKPPMISEDQTELASILGVQAALAIENANLKAEAAVTAVAGERDRIARELHDSVTQTLYSATLIAEAVPKFWRQKPDEAAHDLEELRVLTQGAQAEMRTLLLELRPSELTDRQLSELLRQLTDAMSARTELPISLTIAGDCQVPPDVHIALYRITQEALNNINKHARAHRAWVTLTCIQEGVTLRIGDNGCGFIPETRHNDHLGIKIMHERAEAINAELTIESQLDQGTEVTVDWRTVRVSSLS